MDDDDSFPDPIDDLPQIKLHITDRDTNQKVIVHGNFDNVESICRHIEFSPDFGIMYEDQIIVHRGTLLHDKTTKLADLGIIDKEMRVELFTKLEPQIKIINVLVKREDYNIDFEIDSQATVLEMKKLIDKLKGVSPRRQVLEVLNVIMDNDDTLIKEYVTCRPFEVELRENPQDPESMIKINVMNTDKENDECLYDSECLEVEKYDTVYTLHGEVRRAEIAEGTFFYLEWKGQRLDGERTLSYYGIKENDFVYVKYED